MAARLNPKVQEEVKKRIQTSLLITRLQDHALGEVEMTKTQIQAAIALIDRTVPKMAQIQHSGDESAPILHKIERVIVKPND